MSVVSVLCPMVFGGFNRADGVLSGLWVVSIVSVVCPVVIGGPR